MSPERLQQLTICASTNLCKDDLDVLTLLYLPLIKMEAYSTYLTLYTMLERASLTSQILLLKDITDLLTITPKKFHEARMRLEAIGLLTTYAKESEYLLLLNSPLTAKQFLTDGVLGLYLCGELGEDHFSRIFKRFQISKIDKRDFSNITKSFDEVYQSATQMPFDYESYIIGRKQNKAVRITHHTFDFERFCDGAVGLTVKLKHSPKFQKFIQNLAFTYAYDELLMQRLFQEAFAKNGAFDYTIFGKLARAHYEYSYKQSAPQLSVKDQLADDEMQEVFESMTAVELLKRGTTLQTALPKDVHTIEQLYDEYHMFGRGYINLGVTYILKKLKGEMPVYSYFQKMFQDWQSKGITNFILARQYVFRDTEQVEKTKEEPAKKKNWNHQKPKKENPEWLQDYIDNIEDGVDRL